MSITEPRRRELAAVMFTDMVGFTALMQQDEPTGIENRTRWTTAMERHHDAVGGEVVQWFGDGALSRFPNTVDAIACAVGIQTDLRPAPAVDVRIGIHVGNVMMEPTGLLGDAVNIASRVESFATPGSVVISDTVHDQVKNQPDLKFVDLGKVRFKNVGRPFTLYAIADDALAVPDSGHLSGKGDQIARFPGTIPERGSQLIGREDDLEHLKGLLDEYRVVTVTGPGGVGKTSIAIDLCHRLRADFLDGVAFVDLSAVTHPDGVIPAVAETLDVKEAEGRSLADGVAALIGDSQALVVLDNMEQVVDAAPDLADLLNSCPLLTLLVTSRGPLHIAAEQEYPLSPLGLPDEDDISVASGSPAVALFVVAARRAKPGFELTEENASSVAAICRRLDGLPLAIELAAARIRLLSPQALFERLGTALDVLTSGGRDRPGRHQALRATVDWSHQQLSAEEQQLFRRLSVFVGGATIDGIEAVCSDGGLSLDTLEGLVDHALIQASGDRFGMLQTIWEFAGEQLAASGEADEIQDKYADFMHGVTMAIRDGIEGGDQVEAIQRGVDEDTNITAALDHLLRRATAGDAGAAELAMQICGDLWMFW
ncbi:MAG: adenylate/guanylate cyclase domain-containing protein, partial [Acidimicrobiia bacterium]|nr:adenylate/guanylate cyclase domain-containing protein [Acidimicrobiia bacterium]